MRVINWLTYFLGAVFLVLVIGADDYARSAAASAQAAPPMVEFDFARSATALGWTAAHDVAALDAGAQGLRFSIGGSDPYLYGPPRDYPAGQPLWVTLRLRSEQGGDAQLFYFRDHPSEADSVHFACRPGVWEDARVPVPALGPGYRLRFDPPGDSGACTVARLAVLPRTVYEDPAWLPPDPPNPPNEDVAVQSGDLRIVLASAQWNDFVVSVAGRPMAIGHTRPLIGLADGGKARWLDIGRSVAGARAVKNGSAIATIVTMTEPGGTRWQVRQTFTPAAPGAIDVATEVSVEQDRSVLYLPMMTILPGSGTFGAKKEHALFAGLEYLDANEPSSSEADIEGPGSHRQTPDSAKVTMPLMVVQNDGRYVGLSWTPDAAFCPLFDSPDRKLGSGGHVMAMLYPGSDGQNREEGRMLPYAPQELRAGRPLVLHATILGGKGASVVPAVAQYVALRGLPPLPRTGLTRRGYVDLAAAGWLDTGLGAAGRYRHAQPGSFQPQPAADAAAYLDWLADNTTSDAQRARLRDAAAMALAQAPPSDRNVAAIGHVRYPLPVVLYGGGALCSQQAREAGHELLKQFALDGSLPYRRKAGGPDFGRTHFAPDANGLTAQAVGAVLDCAAQCGEPELVRAGLKLLDGLDKFAGSAPRGAQTWEVPLHTPDILASAYLVRAYTLGFALSADPRYLEAARYWAWTGVPFVYGAPPLTQPAAAESGSAAPAARAASDPIGVYATVAVYGATQWVAPNWMGRPVQWCGLVYADALYRLYKYDSNPDWKTIADGITLSGMQQTWPRGSDPRRQGLLPDSVTLRSQIRNDPGINPGTLEADAAQLWMRGPLCDLQGFQRNPGIYVHSPGEIRVLKDDEGLIKFTVAGWPKRTYRIIVVGLKRAPQLVIDDRRLELGSNGTYSAADGLLELPVSGKVTVEMRP